jgi:hypothetical protein
MAARLHIKAILLLHSRPAFQASNIQRHGFICRPGLQCIVAAFLRMAFATCESVRHGFQILLKFILVSDAFGAQQFFPFVSIHFLVGHESNFKRFDFLALHQFNQMAVLQVVKDASQMVDIHLNKCGIVPLLDNLFLDAFFDAPIEDTFFHIDGLGGCEVFFQLLLNIRTKLGGIFDFASWHSLFLVYKIFACI